MPDPVRDPDTTCGSAGGYNTAFKIQVEIFLWQQVKMKINLKFRSVNCLNIIRLLKQLSKSIYGVALKNIWLDLFLKIIICGGVCM